MDYNTEREDNIIKNIAKEIVLECVQNGMVVPEELANYVVKLKLLNPKNGFTASEVMPRSLTQQLVLSVVEDLKQDTPAMNCIRMQVYWKTVNLNVADLKKEYFNILNEKSDPFLTDIINLEKEDSAKLPRLSANYVLLSQDLGSTTNQIHLKETIAAIHSILKVGDTMTFFALKDDEKQKRMKRLTKEVTGVRLYLKSTGRAGEVINDVKTLTTMTDSIKNSVFDYAEKVADRVDDIRNVISTVMPMDYFAAQTTETADIYLPPESDMKDLRYVKQILVIMLQLNVYLSDIMSKLDEIDGNANFFLNEYYEVLDRLQATIRDRDAVPVSEIFDDFYTAGQTWLEIQSYIYCLQCVEVVIKKLKKINKSEYFIPTNMEKIVYPALKSAEENRAKKSKESLKSLATSSIVLLGDVDDFHLEFSGSCAWTLFYADGFIVPGSPGAGIYQHNNHYFAFCTKIAHELWCRDPNYYLMQIYEILRMNPEMIELLNSYDFLYKMKSHVLMFVTDAESTDGFLWSLTSPVAYKCHSPLNKNIAKRIRVHSFTSIKK